MALQTLGLLQEKNRRIQELEDEVDSLKEKENRYRSKLSTLESAVKFQDKKISELLQRNQEAQKRVRELEQDVKPVKREGSSKTALLSQSPSKARPRPRPILKQAADNEPDETTELGRARVVIDGLLRQLSIERKKNEKQQEDIRQDINAPDVLSVLVANEVTSELKQEVDKLKEEVRELKRERSGLQAELKECKDEMELLSVRAKDPVERDMARLEVEGVRRTEFVKALVSLHEYKAFDRAGCIRSASAGANVKTKTRTRASLRPGGGGGIGGKELVKRVEEQREQNNTQLTDQLWTRNARLLKQIQSLEQEKARMTNQMKATEEENRQLRTRTKDTSARLSVSRGSSLSPGAARRRTTSPSVRGV